MRNLLAFLAAAALTLFAVGWYLDWFQIHTVPSESGHRRVTVDINTQKIGHDLSEAEHKVQKKLEDKNKVSPAGQTDPGTGSTVKPAAGPESARGPIEQAVSGALRKLDALPDR
jgi:hypothetical protein